MGFFSLKIQHVLFALKSGQTSILAGKIHFVLQETQFNKQSVFLQNEKSYHFRQLFNLYFKTILLQTVFHSKG